MMRRTVHRARSGAPMPPAGDLRYVRLQVVRRGFWNDRRYATVKVLLLLALLAATAF